jgi:dipeptidyl aminopeptidase/acylaminoacyl peptidase
MTVARRKRTPLIAAIVLIALTLATVTTAIVVGNSFSYTSRSLAIPTAAGSLEAILTSPAQATGASPVIIFLHGDGPIAATASELYNPIFEAFARAGYASLSWSKPGVGESSGNWLDQTQQDRADEALGVIDFLASIDEIDASRVGIWAASQGGWVAPLVATQSDAVEFVTVASPAINWLDQGRFNLLAELSYENATDADIAQAIEESDRGRQLLAESRDYSDYRETLPADEEPMSADRWQFVLKNFQVDATESLTELGQTEIPVLLLLGANDRNVNIAETEKVYSTLLDDTLSTRIFAGANHSLARSSVEDNPVIAVLTATFAPRSLFAPGYLDALTSFAKQNGSQAP